MRSEALRNPALTVALALAFGILSQGVARHLRVPGIVVLLAVGVLLGPEVAGLIHPETIGALQMLIGFAVAVILFEGGLQLDVRRLRRESKPIRRLVTLGALVTAVLGAALAGLVMRWDLRTSILFGTLVMVTGPTVINPLLRRLRVEHTVATVLEAEGVLVDAVGAVVATVAIEVALSPTQRTFFIGIASIFGCLAFGAVAGLLFGWLLGKVLNRSGLIPEGLENVFTLAFVLALYQTSNAIVPESGIAAVIAAGVVMGNERTHLDRKLMEFKEQLTVMFIGMLFVLLAAGVRLADVRALGWRGAITVVALMWVVRPISVFASTRKSSLSTKQKLFVAWIGPRGIVAAAVASFFASRLDEHGVQGGNALRAMVFLVIAITVVVAGVSGGAVARLLGVRRQEDAGYVLLGANELALAVATTLRDAGEEVLCIDTNPHACKLAEAAGVRAIQGNALDTTILHRAQIDTRSGVVGLASNDELNLLFVEAARGEAKLGTALSAVSANAAVADLVRAHHGEIAFGRPVDVATWSVRIRHKDAFLRALQRTSGESDALPPEGAALALTVKRGKRTSPIGETHAFSRGDEVTFLVDRAHEDDFRAWLHDNGWSEPAEQLVA